MVALASGLIAGALLPRSWGIVLTFLVSWNITVWMYLGLMSSPILSGDPRLLGRLALQEDPNAIFALSLMSIGAAVSLVAIIVEPGLAKNQIGSDRLLHYLLTGGTVLGSWLLIAVMYSFHYAHLYYRSGENDKPIRFPDPISAPGYWDFLYFAFTIAVTAQTSDVSVMSTSGRKTVLAQSILAFLFNVIIVGMSINIAAAIVNR